MLHSLSVFTGHHPTRLLAGTMAANEHIRLTSAVPLSSPTHPASPVAATSTTAAAALTFTAVVIFLHGVGSTGDELRQQLSLLVQPSLEQRFPHIRFLYPTAALRPFTAFKGRVLPAWFDRSGYGLQWDEDMAGIFESCAQLNQLTQQCNASGISNQRIVIGGFSMGGAQAVHAAYSAYGVMSSLSLHSSAVPVPLAGCFCIASYLPRSCCHPFVPHAPTRSGTGHSAAIPAWLVRQYRAARRGLRTRVGA